MKQVMVVWSNGTDEQFERSTPLRYLGERNHRLGFANNIHLVFLSGMERLSPAYLRALTEAGYNIENVEAIYRHVAGTYKTLNRFGRFELNCFVRWLVLEEFLSGEPVLHFDADVVFNVDPTFITDQAKGTTFVLQGCPALTSISDTNWFKAYKEQLTRFASNIDQFSQVAWSEREGWEESMKTKWAGSRFRRIISSDQDLLSHLIHRDVIPQDRPETIMRRFDGLALFENPLVIHEAFNTFPLRYRRSQNGDLINEMPVLMWHMQSDWVFYLSKYLNRLRLAPFLTSRRLGYHQGGAEEVINKLLRNISRGRSASRLRVYHAYFEEFDFSSVMRNGIWWRDGVFA